MHDTNLFSFRFALLTGLGLLQACTPEQDPVAVERGTPQDGDGAVPADPTANDAAFIPDRTESRRDAAASPHLPDMTPTASALPEASTGDSNGDAPTFDTLRDAAPALTPLPDAGSPSSVSMSDSVTDGGRVVTDETTLDPSVDAAVASPRDFGCDVGETTLPTGEVQCSSGLVHRPSAVTCQNRPATDEKRPLPVSYVQAMLADAGTADAGVPYPPLPFAWQDRRYYCYSDSDCAAQGYDYCVEQPGFYADVETVCVQTCSSDADCSLDALCVCDGPIAHCERGGCRTDADCGAGELCAQYTDWCSAEPTFACTSPDDQCLFDSACTLRWCSVYEDDGHRSCVQQECAVGRPFLVAGDARLARAVTSTAWLCRPMNPPHSAPVAEATLSPELTAHLAREWTNVALMEHASIAAFARFALQLLSLGAPPEFIYSAQRAMADETRHACLAFNLASRFADAPVGPGPLHVNGALDCSGLRGIVLDTFIEGCIGETVAALEASHALEGTVDLEVSAVLRTIARDERTHAELAWRFVAWALAQRPELGSELVSCLREQAQSLPTRPPSATALDRAALGYGIVCNRDRLQLRHGVLHELVTPCLQALVQRSAGTGRPRERQGAFPTLAS